MILYYVGGTKTGQSGQSRKLWVWRWEKGHVLLNLCVAAFVCGGEVGREKRGRESSEMLWLSSLWTEALAFSSWKHGFSQCSKPANWGIVRSHLLFPLQINYSF